MPAHAAQTRTHIHAHAAQTQHTRIKSNGHIVEVYTRIVSVRGCGGAAVPARLKSRSQTGNGCLWFTNGRKCNRGCGGGGPAAAESQQGLEYITNWR